MTPFVDRVMFTGAHTDMYDPFDFALVGTDADSSSKCATCHADVTVHGQNSLHNTLQGYDTILMQRALDGDWSQIEEMQTFHCNSCHATCGECHVSRPNSVGGGLVAGHTFQGTPSMGENCTACHGSRVGNEYLGRYEDPRGGVLPADVHSQELFWTCTNCHTGTEMHGAGMQTDATWRYDTPGELACQACHSDAENAVAFYIPPGTETQLPSHLPGGYDSPVACESCHSNVVGAESEILPHLVHSPDLMSCQTCHSQPYINCTNCHVDRANDAGMTPYYSVQDDWLGFYIGRNPIQSEERPYQYVVVRHVPIDANSFDYYGDDLLMNFMDRPTWVYATPHNIMAPGRTCTACHGTDTLFLTADKVAPSELEANLDVIVPAAPSIELMQEGFQPSSPTDAEPADEPADTTVPDTDDDADASFWGDDAAEIPDSSAPAADDDSGTDADTDFWGDGAVEESSETDEPAAEDDAGFWDQ
ncbi:MAG: hypothetical protein GYB65_23430 [Chloroflexi bacterium]|nr:hypothetical protein [Chloroflexota bacterium]